MILTSYPLSWLNEAVDTKSLNNFSEEVSRKSQEKPVLVFLSLQWNSYTNWAELIALTSSGIYGSLWYIFESNRKIWVLGSLEKIGCG